MKPIQDCCFTNKRNAFRSALLLVWVLLLSGCAAFSWIPGIGDDEDDEEPSLLNWSILMQKSISSVSGRAKSARVLERNTFDCSPWWSLTVWSLRTRTASLLHLIAFRRKNLAAEGRGRGASRFGLDRFWTGVTRAVSGGVGGGEGLVLLGTTRGNVIALALSDGTEQWRTCGIRNWCAARSGSGQSVCAHH